MNIFKWLFGSRKHQPNTIEGSKDPKDYKKDKLSTGWEHDDHYCSRCNCSTGHNEFMTDTCNSCGNFHTQHNSGRNFRKIYIDGQWKYQIRYEDGREEIRKEWYKAEN